MSALKATQAYYEEAQTKAATAAAQTLREYGFEVRILRFSRRTDLAIDAQWTGRTVAWDWPEIARRYREPKSYCFATWGPNDRLSGLGLITLTKTAATIRFVEGDPRPDCPLSGKRTLIALEVATNYAQLCGLEELRIHPLNEALGTLYQDVYGFELVKPHKEEPYYRKRI